MLERLRHVLRVKALVTYKGEHFKAGVFDTKVDYTFIHPDYSEETGTVHVEGTGTSVAMEVVSSSEVVLPKHVLHPFKIEASFKPNTEFKVDYTGSFGHAVAITLSKAGQTMKVHAVHKHPEHEHTYDVEVNVREKKMLVVHKEDGTEQTHLSFELQGKLMSLKMVKMSGNIQGTRWFEGGPVESVFVVKGDDYEFNIIHNNNEVMKTKMNVKNHMLMAKINLNMSVYKGTVYVNYDTVKKVFEVSFPKEWFADEKKFGLKVTVAPIDVDHPYLGGVYTVFLVRDDVPFFKFDIDFKFINDAAKHELVFNHVHVESLNVEHVNSFFDLLPVTKYDFCHGYLTSGCFEKGEFTGRIFYDKVNKNHFFNKFSVKGTFTKKEMEVFDLVLDTVATPHHFSVFYPHFLQKMFNRPIERLTLDVHHEVSGPDQTLMLTTNYDNLKFKLEHKPDHISATIMKNKEPYVVFVQEYQLIDDHNKFVFSVKPTLHFHPDSLLHKELCEVSSYMCFHDLKGDVHVEVVDKASRKVDVKVMVHQDESEVYHLEVTNKQTPYIIIFKSPYVVPLFNYIRGQSWFAWMMPVVKTPFDVIFKFDPVQKTLMLKTNIDTHENLVEVVPLGGDKFNVEFNHEAVAEFVAGDKTVEVVKTLKDGTKMTTVVSWTRGDLVENTATVTVMYKHVELVGTLEWNVRDLAHGTFVVDVKGTKVPTLGDFMVNRNVKWEVKNAHEFELVWDGQANSNVVQALTTPIVTDAKIAYNNKNLQVEVKEKVNEKTFTLLFNTKPFKFALLPIFEL